MAVQLDTNIYVWNKDKPMSKISIKVRPLSPFSIFESRKRLKTFNRAHRELTQVA